MLYTYHIYEALRCGTVELNLELCDCKANFFDHTAMHVPCHHHCTFTTAFQTGMGWTCHHSLSHLLLLLDAFPIANHLVQGTFYQSTNPREVE